MSPEEFKKKYGTEKPSDDGKNIVFQCRSGNRSRKAIEAVGMLGVTK
jgi:rhodanese-related sulfurtransferase